MEKRKPTIGGSEIATVMGLNRWKTPLRLWAEKTGKFQKEDVSGREYIQLGNELEDFVARKFARVTGKAVRRDTKTFKNKTYPYMIAHIDRRITGENAILECKTCNAWKAHEWEGEDIPQEYILQVMWYLGILGMTKGYIAVLIGGQKFVWKEIEFDMELYIRMRLAAKQFIEHYIAKDIAPMAISGDSATMMRLCPEHGNKILTGNFEVDTLITKLQVCKNIIKDKEKLKEELEAKLKQEISEAEGIETERYRAIWKSQTSKRMDVKRLKDDGLYDKYSVLKSTRVLRINEKKELKNGKAK